ncbi:putative membrane protein [Francisella philomiragia]|uniref:Putative membrane protein n=2 Tax=Francisella philomiragia TaxID=28110 RepID=A0A0B6CSK3_9GAMM|nr:putative membrane protein [Francisella philomiragia]
MLKQLNRLSFITIIIFLLFLLIIYFSPNSILSKITTILFFGYIWAINLIFLINIYLKIKRCKPLSITLALTFIFTSTLILIYAESKTNIIFFNIFGYPANLFPISSFLVKTSIIFILASYLIIPCVFIPIIAFAWLYSIYRNDIKSALYIFFIIIMLSTTLSPSLILYKYINNNENVLFKNVVDLDMSSNDKSLEYRCDLKKNQKVLVSNDGRVFVFINVSRQKPQTSNKDSSNYRLTEKKCSDNIILKETDYFNIKELIANLIISY